MDKLIAEARLEVTIKFEDADPLKQAEKEEGVHSMNFKMKGIENEKVFTMNTSNFETKLKAIQTLQSLAKNLGKSFATYFKQTFEVALEVLPFEFNASLRMAAGKTIRYLIKAIETPAQKVELFQASYTTFVAMIEK